MEKKMQISESYGIIKDLAENPINYNLTERQIKAINVASKALLAIELLGISSSQTNEQH